MAISTGNLVDIVNIRSYKDSDIYNYNKVIILCNLEGSIKDNLKENIMKFNGDIFWVGKNYDEFKNQKKISHIDLDDLNSSSEEKLFNAFGYSHKWCHLFNFSFSNAHCYCINIQQIFFVQV